MTPAWAVVLGAAIALLSGPITESVRSYFARKHAKQERREEFQRDTLLALLDHLSEAMQAAILAAQKLNRMDQPDAWQLDEVVTFMENIVAARRFRVLVPDDRVRALVEETIETAGRALLSGNEADSNAGIDKATQVYRATADRIGALVRNM
jgi:hypothetical protein